MDKKVSPSTEGMNGPSRVLHAAPEGDTSQVHTDVQVSTPTLLNKVNSCALSEGAFIASLGQNHHLGGWRMDILFNVFVTKIHCAKDVMSNCGGM